jgi:hypothetical protein
MIRRMTGRAVLQRRTLLLAAAAASGVMVGHLLDALGLLPGVQEPVAVRAAALAPHYTVLTIVGASAVALVAEALLRRGRPARAGLALVIGQTALLGLPEVLAEVTGQARATTTGATSGEGGELAKLALAVGLQVLLAALAVLVAVVVDLLLPRLPRLVSSVRIPDARLPVPPLSALPAGRIVGGVRGRGPPLLLSH